MITPIKTMTINQIIERQDDLLVSFDDVKAIAKNERTEAFNQFIKLYRVFLERPSEKKCTKEDTECDGMCIDCFAEWIKKLNK